MSKEPTIACTMCDEHTTHYWTNFDEAAHMVCDACFIQLSHMVNNILENEDDFDTDTVDFAYMYNDWRNGALEYQVATPQSMMERFFIGLITKELE